MQDSCSRSQEHRESRGPAAATLRRTTGLLRALSREHIEPHSRRHQLLRRARIRLEHVDARQTLSQLREEVRDLHRRHHGEPVPTTTLLVRIPEAAAYRRPEGLRPARAVIVTG